MEGNASDHRGDNFREGSGGRCVRVVCVDGGLACHTVTSGWFVMGVDAELLDVITWRSHSCDASRYGDGPLEKSWEVHFPLSPVAVVLVGLP